MRTLQVIGWSEYIELPDWGVSALKAKTDTGARTSALHVENLEELPDGTLRFEVMHGTRRRPQTTTVVARPSKWGRVRSSNGHYTHRYFVRTTLRVGPVEREIEISLVSRERMLFRMLLGRKALERVFLVDPGRRAVLSERPRRKKPKPLPHD